MGSCVRMSHSIEFINSFGDSIRRFYSNKFNCSSDEIEFLNSNQMDGIIISIPLASLKIHLKLPLFEGDDSGDLGYWVEENFSMEEVLSEEEIKLFYEME